MPPHSRLRAKILAIGAALVLFNSLAWVWAFAAFQGHSVLMGTALLAYSFGLRHAVDADHIAAIDNVTRKLMQEGKRPVAVGLLFSLGHSAVVVILSLLVALTTAALQNRLEAWQETGGWIGTAISAGFLFAIAAANTGILKMTWRSFRRVRNGLPAEEEGHHVPVAGGLMARLWSGLFRQVGRGWHMFLLGLLFGLGFETATEVSLLGFSAAGASEGLSPWSIMVFPALFSAGMALIDTADGVLMLGAYGWAFVRPLRKLYYNLTITALSVMVAIVIGSIETLGLIRERFNPEGRFWRLVGIFSDNFGFLGYGMIALFAVGWLISLMIYRIKGYDEIEAVAPS